LILIAIITDVSFFDFLPAKTIITDILGTGEKNRMFLAQIRRHGRSVE